MKCLIDRRSHNFTQIRHICLINILYLICADGNDLYVSCNPWQLTVFLSPYNLDEMAPHGAFSHGKRFHFW